MSSSLMMPVHTKNVLVGLKTNQELHICLPEYLYRVSAQQIAIVHTELQFLAHSMIKREHSRRKAKLALKSDAFETTGIPVKDDLMQNAKLRNRTVSNLMLFKSSIPDTAPFGKRSRHDAITVKRDWEESISCQLFDNN
ncbi:hypothetical protein DPMN_037826 [Dreissena polymorpha]|uniref:Uncharacterized protein n=1 Tax=Dreissena polymorpha TaxID=45954 RepID=A0A9D4MEA1_DREPO|nr:hypothetical protein DPMN_037826 [Dreissena polymorpha]